ncbi:exosome complex component RRP41-like [Oratosquilla oratoria]|uniref:exosome complex component RRP41-like n=1 Tax=Oratosquilla oratoria TaxID=337810 RepID=UPI003F769F69
MEILSTEGLRQDGRTRTCLRKIDCRLGVYERPNGSGYIEMGSTKVLAAVYGPREVRSFSKQNLDECVIQCQMSRIAASQGERVRRPRDPRTRAMSLQVAGIFQAAIRKSKYPGSQIDIYVQVLQADGSVMAACINASTLALMHAGVELVDFVVACTASSYKGQPFLDVTNMETINACELTVSILPNKGHGEDDEKKKGCKSQGQIVSLDTTHTLHRDHFEEVLDLARVGCQQVYEIMHQEVQQYLQDKHAIMSHR